MQLVPAGYRGRVLNIYGVPIMGATITAYRPDLGLIHATTTTDPNGCFKLPCEGYGDKYRIEFINGSETVTIQGDEIEVETVEMVRAKRLAERRRDEEARWQTPKISADIGVFNWPLDGWRATFLSAFHMFKGHSYRWSELSVCGNRWRVCRCGWRHEVFGP